MPVLLFCPIVYMLPLILKTSFQQLQVIYICLHFYFIFLCPKLFLFFHQLPLSFHSRSGNYLNYFVQSSTSGSTPSYSGFRIITFFDKLRPSTRCISSYNDNCLYCTQPKIVSSLLTNSMAYETRRFNATFTRSIQISPF